jgi:hypothetical protein
MLAVGACWALDDAFAQAIEHGRGNIVSIDMNRSTVNLRDPQNRVTTWRFQSDAKVKFTDGAPFYPNPSVRDLRPPMYVHYTFTNEVIVSFDVAELGFNPGDPKSSSAAYKREGYSRTVVGRVSAYDPSVRQVAVEHDGQTEAFQLTERTDQRLEPGTQVELRTDWSGQRELVSQLRVVNDTAQGARASSGQGGRASGQGNRGSGQGDSSYGQGDSARRQGDRTSGQGGQAYGKEQAYRKGGASSGWSTGRVVRISSRGVLMEVAGTRETYGVANSRLANRLRAGQTVRFDWEDRDGRPYITDIR